MGEDIHIATYVKSRVENKYINAFNLTTSPQYFPFKPFFEGRYYDLFSLFGSQRSDMKPLKRSNDGVPDFVNPTYNAYLQEMGYYGFVWFNIVDLKKSIEEYIAQLEDPELYYTDKDEDDIYIEQIKNGKFNTRAWKLEHAQPLKKTLNEILKSIDCMLDDEDNLFDKLLNLKETTFIIYFDS